MLLLLACLLWLIPLAAVAAPPQITLTWEAAAPRAGTVITGYQVQGCQVPPGQTTCTPVDLAGAIVSATTLTYVDKAVIVGNAYRYTVVTVGTINGILARSDPSNLVFLQLTPQLPPAQTVQVVALIPAPGSPAAPVVRVTWQAPLFDTGTVLPTALTGYQVWRRPNGGILGWITLGTALPTAGSFEDTAPLPDGCYALRTLYGTLGNAPDTATVCVALPLPPTLAAPLNLRATAP